MQIALMMLAAALAFGASLWNGRVYDDFSLFSDPLLFAPSGWWEIWIERTRPLTYFTFWAEFQITDEPVRLQHAVNLLLHLAAVWLAAGCFKRLLPASAAIVAGILFAIHPIQGETVNYIWARGNLLMSVFCLLALRDWIRDHQWRSVIWFVLALLAKEEAVAFPLVLGLLRFRLRPIVAMLAFAGAAGARVLWVASTTPGSQAGPQAPYSAAEYFWTQGLVILRYFAMVVWPFELTPDPALRAGAYWWAWLLVALACFAAWKRFSTGVWFLSAVILLLPSSSVFAASELYADRRMYLPMLAVAGCLGLLLQRWAKAAVLAVVTLIPLDIVRTRIWQSDDTLWADALRKNGDSVRARLLLARGATHPADVIPLLEEAKKIDPLNAAVASQLGRAYLTVRGAEAALAEFGRALALAPNSPEALSNRGVALAMMKQTDAAKADFERALKADPCFWEARYNLKRLGFEATNAAGCRYTPWQQQSLDEIK